LLRLEASIQDYPKNIYDVTALDMINYLLESNPKLAFYKSRLFDGLALISRRDGDIETELENLNAGIENAKNFDDLHRLAHLLRTKAGMIQSTDRTAALELLRESQKLMEVLGDDSGLADVLFHISKLTAIRGEFNKAIEYLLDCVRINESLGAPQGIFALMLSTYYNIIGNPNAGFEWAKLAETESRPTIIPRAILNQAWSATLQREYDTASEIIDSTREAILKSGLESNLGWLYFISGVLEMHLGRYDDAAGSLENAIDIYERRGGLMSMLICSLYRARLEIVLMNDVDSDLSDEEELPWIYLMEEKTRVDDMPGFLGLVLLLKLEVTRLMNKEETPLAIAAEIWTIARDYDLSFLQEALDRVNPI
jgi:tetratricopeptide (TPR) repeat protein